MDIHELITRAKKLYGASPRSVLAIAGPPGSGKTTLAKQLVEALGDKDTVVLLPLDGYHLSNATLDERGIRNIKGAPQTFDVDSYIDLLRNVRNFPEKTWYAPDFSHKIDEPVSNAIAIKPDVRLVITEGNYLLLPGKWGQVKRLCDETWFLDIDPAIERKRLIKRQIEESGRTLDTAIDWVDRNDLANAAFVRNHSAEPTLRFMLK